MANELMIDDLTLMSVYVDKDSVKGMAEIAKDESLPNVFTIDGIECSFKIKRKEKEFYILNRNSYRRHPLSHMMPSDAEIDFIILKSIKIALQAGYKVFLEPKFSN
jgi:hypothetical protein